jgi:hypothetical protein
LNLICSIAGHRPDSGTIRNEGHHFSRCLRCRADLIEQGGRWITAPRGYRIVWKDPELQLDMPAEDLPPEPKPAPARRARKPATAKAARPKKAPSATGGPAKKPGTKAKTGRPRRKPSGKA